MEKEWGRGAGVKEARSPWVEGWTFGEGNREGTMDLYPNRPETSKILNHHFALSP